jgi:plasmid stabilization system protein ParE
MVPVVWTEPARDDLAEIGEYIAQDSKVYAKATVQRIRAKAGMLRQFPDMGHVLPDCPGTPYRQLICGAYRIIYRMETKPRRAVISAVVHAARLIQPILANLNDDS